MLSFLTFFCEISSNQVMDFYEIQLTFLLFCLQLWFKELYFNKLFQNKPFLKDNNKKHKKIEENLN